MPFFKVVAGTSSRQGGVAVCGEKRGKVAWQFDARTPYESSFHLKRPLNVRAVKQQLWCVTMHSRDTRLPVRSRLAICAGAGRGDDEVYVTATRGTLGFPYCILSRG